MIRRSYRPLEAGLAFPAVARIALVNAPFHSHIAAMMRLAGVLAGQGHDLVVWAPLPWQAHVERLGARFHPSSPEMPRAPDPVSAAALAATTEQEAGRLIPALHADAVDVVVRDSQATWALVAAEYLGIPRIVAHPMFPMLGSAGGGRVREVADPPASDAAEEVGFARTWLSIARRWGVELADVRGLYHRTSEPTLTFTTEEIVGDLGLPETWRCIGPLLCALPRSGAENRRPLVYACFGTAQNRRTDLFRTVIAAMARQPMEVLISAGGRRLTADELGPLPDNVTVRQFVPSREALTQAAIHITHGGCNSVHESLMAAVPMVCLPQAFDQIPLSRRVEELGVGVTAEADPDAVAHAVNTLLSDEQAWARAEALSERLQRYDSEARVAAAIAACV
jgi:MGT family glycosyltransferase